jgi:hypothetical protein
MQVNAIRNNGTNFTMNNREHEALENLAYANDKQLYKLATLQAKNSEKVKKSSRISNAMLWAIPAAYGLEAAASVPSGGIKGARRLTAVIRGSKAAASMVAIFATVGAVFGLKNKVSEHSKIAKKFDKEHPFLAFTATVGATLGALALGKKGISKLINKINSNVTEAEVIKSTKNLCNLFAESKVLNKASEYIRRVPSSIRAVAKEAIEWTPNLLLFGTLFHSFKAVTAESMETSKAYRDLKVAQANAREVLENEEA